MKIWEPKLPGALWATPGLLQDSFTFYLYLTCLLTVVVGNHGFRTSINEKVSYPSAGRLDYWEYLV